MGIPEWTPFIADDGTAASSYTYAEWNLFFGKIFSKLGDPTAGATYGDYYKIGADSLADECVTAAKIGTAAVKGSGTGGTAIQAKTIGYLELGDGCIGHANETDKARVFVDGTDLSDKNVVTYRSKRLGSGPSNNWTATGTAGLIIGSCSVSVTVESEDGERVEVKAADLASMAGLSLTALPDPTHYFIQVEYYNSTGNGPVAPATPPTVYNKATSGFWLLFKTNIGTSHDTWGDDKVYHDKEAALGAIKAHILVLAC
jgi:hypothetical protein